MEEGYPEEELAEDREVNEKVLGDEECDAREEDLGSEGEFGLIEAAYEPPGSPTSEVQYTDFLLNLPKHGNNKHMSALVDIVTFWK